MRSMIAVRWLVLMAGPLLVGTIGQADEPKKAKRPPNDSLPITRFWDLTELVKLGKIVQTRNEAQTKNRIVWTLEVKEMPKNPGLQVDFQDDERGRLYTETEIEYRVLKSEDDKDKVKRLEVILKLPSREVQQNTYFAVFKRVQPSR
jgi:hypothetical protein